MTFKEALAQQRWDDHRYYHHNRVNQSLHFLSAIGFVVAYVWLFIEPAVSVLIAWLWSMPTRQAGHFFFEPKGYDAPNQATHEYKEDIKVGYNLHRKVWLMSLWALSPALLIVSPSGVGLLEPAVDGRSLVHNVSMLWLIVGLGGVVFRVLQLFAIKDIQTGLVWATKILTDPFHDLKLYYRAPVLLLRGETFDPVVRPESTRG
jgi:hypothetical protein